jgi:aminoglycoside 3-N-acetyltransferase
MSSLGYVLGGAQTCVRALLDAVGPTGTFVMPAFSPEVSDPAAWDDPRVCEVDIDYVWAQISVFDPTTTPTAMGAIPEAFRTWPGVLRSNHPQVSVCAIGPTAAAIVEPHQFAWGQGPGSPFERLYELDARLLLLGVGFNRATLLHHAESRVPHGRRKVRRFPVDEPSGRRWIEVPDVGDDLNTHFPAIGELVASGDIETFGMIGRPECALVPARRLVDIAQQFLFDALSS